jgi:hypothetical protein
MSTLKEELKAYDFIMDKMKKDKTYMVLHEDLHDVHVWCEGDAPITLPKRMVNMAYIKVDPKVVKVLYGEKDDDGGNDDATDESSEQQ